MKIILVFLVCLFYFNGQAQKYDSVLLKAIPSMKASMVNDKEVFFQVPFAHKDVIPEEPQRVRPSIRTHCLSSVVPDPLMVIDGIVNSKDDLSHISPDNIDSIWILKGLMAQDIYGCSGSNGVILITTKTARLKKIIIKDEDGSPVPGATISILPDRLGGDTLNLFADSDGVVATDKLLNKQSYNLNVTSVGYQIKNTNVYFDKMNEETILLNKQYKNCDEVAVVSYGTTRCGFHGCCLWSITKKSFSSTQKDIAQKEFFKLFPNPASRGTQINIQLPKETPAGSKLQLYNISGQLILQQQINRKPDIQKMQLPEIAPGTYHVLVLNSQSQKIFAGKLVVL